MKAARFSAQVMSGHKQAAVEVPFDPGTKWEVASRQIRPGRRGYLARATINETKFDSAIVARSRRFWLLIEDHVLVTAKVQVDEVVIVTVAPLK